MTTHFTLQESFPFRLWKGLKRYTPWILQGCSLPVILWTLLRRWAYRRGWVSRQHLLRPVISVGNITVGGTGKTPMVIWLARRLHEDGRTVAILSRGYGRTLPSENLLVSDGRRLLASWQLSGDEPWLIAQKCPWAIVAVGRDRYRLGCWVLEKLPCDCFIIDDGFQHLHLHRDVDLVLVDLLDPEGMKGVFPFGSLREPLQALTDAGAVVLTRSQGEDPRGVVLDRIKRVRGENRQMVSVKTRLGSCWQVVSGARRPLASFEGQRVLVFSGIGNGQAFVDDVIQHGLQVVEEIRYQDHVRYTAHDIDHLRKVMHEKDLSAALTTEKDAVKIGEWVKEDDPFWVVEMDLDFVRGRDVVDLLLAGVSEKIRAAELTQSFSVTKEGV